jgi:ubiquinone/menaquinone biosynthesis C-methylase UbiE
MEVQDSLHWGSKILIISPPTDTGIRLLVKANQQGQSKLLCFSERLERIAAAYSRKHGIEALSTHVAPYFRIPFANEEFAAIYANCFFDFCQEQEFDMVLDEMWRTLKIGGTLFMVYMGFSRKHLARGWSWVFKQFNFISQGSHPVFIGPYLSRCGFLIRKDHPIERFGFPVRYTFAEKQANFD